MRPSPQPSAQDLLRDLAPQVLGAVIRRFRDFAASEDAVQEALIAAATQWPRDGPPEKPRAWLIQVASRRVADHVRAETARRNREAIVVSLVPPEEQLARGKIDVELQGMKLRGGFTLVRTGTPSADRSDKERWLLIKQRDEYADPSWNIESSRLARSVLTGRSLKEIESGHRKSNVRSGARLRLRRSGSR